jgi:ABC-2 type transport system permease protein
VATVWVSAAHFLPQLVVLIGACLIAGWTPTALQLAAAALAFVLVSVLATGLGLLFSAANVYFRDSENIVDMILMVVTWASPVLYVWTMVKDVMGPWYWLYQLNPLTVAVEIFHWAFWFPTLKEDQLELAAMPPNLLTVWLPVAFLISIAVLFVGQLAFRRSAVHFAQEL